MPGDGSTQKVVISYSTATAQALVITIADSGDTANAGFHALAVATIPEPVSAVLLAAGLMVLLPSAWRKRK